MRRPEADLEEKREPRVTSSARAQKSDGIKSSDWSLTSAAIEKETFAGTRGNDRVAPNPAVSGTHIEREIQGPKPSFEILTLSQGTSARAAIDDQTHLLAAALCSSSGFLKLLTGNIRRVVVRRPTYELVTKLVLTSERSANFACAIPNRRRTCRNSSGDIFCSLVQIRLSRDTHLCIEQ